MPENNLLDEIISWKPKITEDESDEEDMGNEAMGEDNTPCCPEAGRRGTIKFIYKSGVLTRVLSRIRRPPDGMKICGKQHKEAKNEIEKWANDTTVEVLQLELAKQAKSARAADVKSEVVNEESLKELMFDSILEEVQNNTLMLFDTLTRICATSRKNKNEKRDSKFSVTLLINALSYQLSLKSNRMQKLICVYLKAKGVPKSCYYLYQRAGLSLSYEWSRRALEKISTTAMAEVIALFALS
ncbi:hypothetical protein FRC11_000151 [Ceratobasidium sp. 423]|nr:hypothetical protein FRC11_000151 [Ceratobasidium sp. 423]